MSEQFVAACINQHVKTDRVALDIGANRGVYTEMLLEKFGKVYAFEPHPDNINYLHHKFKGRSNLEIVPKAVGATTGSCSLNINPHNIGGHTMSTKVAEHAEWGFTEKKEINIESVTLDDFCRDKDVSFMKIDIEGAEDFVFEGAKETLSREDLTIVIEVHKEVDLIKLFNMFKSYGFTVFGLGLVISSGNNRYETMVVNSFDADNHYLLVKHSKENLT